MLCTLYAQIRFQDSFFILYSNSATSAIRESFAVSS
jgi:hypothetical protein